ncbi:MAG: hypothetical protein HKL90_08715 [Elusimicrobia bacterium]|nr:hypothetical protein [Elusimicrobiota bacterium]
MIARLLLSLAVCAPLTAFAAADEGAYPVLLSMGRAAATDRGPRAGESPYDFSGARRADRGGAMRGRGYAVFPEAVASNAPSSGGNPMETATTAAFLSEPAFASAPAFSFSPLPEAPVLDLQAARMKRWAMRFFRLAPSTRRVRTGRVVLAPGGVLRPVRTTAQPGRDGDASRVGVRRGFAEFLAVASCALP